MTAPPAGADSLHAPPLRRRLACFLYEGVLLFGVVMTAGLMYSTLTDQRHALVGMRGLQAFLFFVLGAYFVYFWVRTGQTLAMLTWHIRLVDAAGQPVGRVRAACRYLLCWLWFVPALLALELSGLKSGAASVAALLAGVAGYAALAWLRSDRQFWHDAVCGTRLIHWTPAQRAAARGAR